MQDAKGFSLHDAVFRQLLSTKEVARDFMTLHLPAEPISLCYLTTLQLESGQFVEESLHILGAWNSGIPEVVFICLSKVVPILCGERYRCCSTHACTARREILMPPDFSASGRRSQHTGC